jgi:hypothetical protein
VATKKTKENNKFENNWENPREKGNEGRRKPVLLFLLER